MVYAGGWVHGIPQALHDANQHNLYTGMDSLRNITPGGGCYLGDADYLEEDWQTAFFGSNYIILRISMILKISLIVGGVRVGRGLMSEFPLSYFWVVCVDERNIPQYSCYAQSMSPVVVTNPL